MSGRRGRGQHSAADRKRPCRLFARSGECRYGRNCKFSHETIAKSVNDASDQVKFHLDLDTPAASDIGETTYHDWRFHIRKISPLARSILGGVDARHLNELWSGAVRILDRNTPEFHQRLAKEIVDDNLSGCEKIHFTLQLRLDEPGGERNIDALESFLKTITHASIMDCLSIDTYVATLYNVISGAGGERAVPFFLNIARSLLKMLPEKNAVTPQRFDGFLSMMLTALNQLLLRERRVCFHDRIPDLLSQLDKMLASLSSTEDGLPSTARLSKRSSLEALKKVVAFTTNRLDQKSAQSGDDRKNGGLAPGVAPSLIYPLEQPTPGGQHDNDHREITNVAIYPTAAELLSTQAEYLPSTDVRQPHFLDGDSVRRYLDTHFRLLRHDVFGPLKAALSPAIMCLEKGPAYRANNDVGVHLYRHVSISHIDVHERRGFEISLVFDVPKQARTPTRDERRRWWERSKRLEPGSLVCLVVAGKRGAKHTLLLIVSQKCTGDTPHSSDHPFDAEDVRSTVKVKLASVREEDLALTAQLYRKRTRGVMVGIPGLIPATFTPILRNLQRTFSTGDLPFNRWTISRTLEEPVPDEPGTVAPRYAQAGHFAFDLSSIARDPAEATAAGGLRICVGNASADDDVLLDKLEAKTTLDRGQCRALVYALTHEFALIQGPPGTGKSYLGVKLLQVLLAAKTKAQLGPVIVICYTNHALDQFLCHLLDVGIRKVIRIGGQSKTPQLEGFNLRQISDQVGKTKNEKYVLGSTYSDLETQLKSAGTRLGVIHKLRKDAESWEVQKRFLLTRYPRIYYQIYRDEVDGFTTVGRDPLQVWVHPRDSDERERIAPMPNTDGRPHQEHRASFQQLVRRAEESIELLNLEDRAAFSRSLLKEIENEQVQKLLGDIEEAEQYRNRVDDVHREVSRRALLTADVIGITTTGLARDISMLRKLRSKVVVCEEAGEVLEAHVISAMMPGVEHLIQIGDHQQLRPQINNFSLSLESQQGLPYQLDRSQFERLAVGQPGLSKVRVAQLSIQRRMRPAVSKLIRSLYPNLQDHGSVLDLPDVVGMRDNVYWLNHAHFEDGASEDGRVRSHSNTWEVAMTKALVRHLIRQGVYKGTDIAVLTPYSGQLHKLRESLHSDFDISISDRDADMLATEGFEEEEGERRGENGQAPGLLQKKRLLESLRLATVDNFQGEEAKVIIVSLVRSNAEGKVGFLRTTNRINVLLSRAQHGMYLIGSADTYSKIPMWVDVQEQLEVVNCLGDRLNICCPRHKETPITCAEPEDFVKNAPEGGCSLPCEWRLERCGHQCLARCHSQAMHLAFQCPRSCPRRRSTCDHACVKLCGEECGSCLVTVNGIRLPCEHVRDDVQCYKTLELQSIKCFVEVKKKMTGCGHVIGMPCHQDASKTECNKPCEAILGCGHACPGTCSKCTATVNGIKQTSHLVCDKGCQRPYSTCNHYCADLCHPDKPCRPCIKPCEVVCPHSKCANECSAPCAPCIEKCDWSCEHQGRCSMPCAGPCDRLPCDKRCLRVLPCGHQCPSLCGEPCPKAYCQSCGHKGEARVDLLEFKTYSEIDLDETPIISLSCGHFFTAESLDGLVGLTQAYSWSSVTDDFVALKPLPDDLPVPKCPDCKRPIRQHSTRRYNRIVNAAIMNEASMRFLARGQADLRALERRTDEAEAALPALESSMTIGSIDAAINKRHKDLSGLLRDAQRFCRETKEEQQPARKLYDAVLSAKDGQRSLEEQMADMSILHTHEVKRPLPEYSVVLGGRYMRLRIQGITLQDHLGLFPLATEDQRANFLPKLTKSLSGFCTNAESLIAGSREQKLPRYAVLATLAFARVVKAMQQTVLASMLDDKDMIKTRVEQAKQLLERASKLCDVRFEGSSELKESVENVLRIFGKEWYESVTAEELQAIKNAMVSGSDGLRTHAGHWYRCSNGHVFAIGECGMPMEEATCPECGARIGGRNHRQVDGMSRAADMERS